MVPGLLSTDRYAFSTPVDAPLYPSPPWQYTDARFLTVTYETDEDAARGALPAELELVTPATASIIFAGYPSSPVGPYNEAIQSIRCRFDGRAYSFIARILLDNDGAIAGGREVWGYPKKFARVAIRQNGNTLSAQVERPVGRTLAAIRIDIGEELPTPGETVPAPGVNVRLVPATEAGTPPSVCELVEVATTLTVKKAHGATGSVEFGEPSEADPWSALPVHRVISAGFSVADLFLPHGRVLKRL